MREFQLVGKASRLYVGAIAALLLGIALFVLLPPKHFLPTICFYTALAVATFCNFSMAKAGIVGKHSPYIFVAISLTVVGFLPMLFVMGYSLAKHRKLDPTRARSRRKKRTPR